MRIISAMLVPLRFMGCSLGYRVAGVPTQHIIMLDNNGKLVDPTGSIECHPDDNATDNAQFLEDRKKQVAAGKLGIDTAEELVTPPHHYTWKPCNGRVFVALRSL